VTSNQAIRRGTLTVYRISNGVKVSIVDGFVEFSFLAAGCAFAGIAFALIRRPRDKEEDPPPPAESG
jgi:hypothetical protein